MFPVAASRGRSSVQSGGAVPPVVVQSASGTTADGSAGLTVNFGVPVTAGNSVVACLSYNNVGDPTGTELYVLDGTGGTARPGTGAYNGTVLGTSINPFNNCGGGETGAIVTLDQAVRASMTILEAENLADAAATDTDTSAGNSDAIIFTGLSGNGLGVVIFSVANATNPFTEASLTAGWTSLGVTGGNGVWHLSAYKIDAIGEVSVSLTSELTYAVAGAVFAAA